eukprot:8168866-Lingulodinium_polyedra.AAC.1
MDGLAAQAQAPARGATQAAMDVTETKGKLEGAGNVGTNVNGATNDNGAVLQQQSVDAARQPQGPEAAAATSTHDDAESVATTRPDEMADTDGTKAEKPR